MVFKQNSMRDIIIRSVDITSSLANKITEVETKINDNILKHD
jgi:hypothetical protein